MKQERTLCDVCGDEIPKTERRMQILRNLLGRLRIRMRWFSPAQTRFDSDRWVSEGFDVCEACRDEIIARVEEGVEG